MSSTQVLCRYDLCWCSESGTLCLYVVITAQSQSGSLTSLADKKCHPEPESTPSARNRRIDENEKHGFQCRPDTMKELNFRSSKHHSQDMASSITRVQEPEKAYSTDMSFTVRTSQPAPIDPMNIPPDFVPKPIFKAPTHVKRTSVQSNGSSQAPIIPLPSPTLSNFDSRSPRRQSDTTAHMMEMVNGNDGALHGQYRITELAQDQRPPR